MGAEVFRAVKSNSFYSQILQEVVYRVFQHTESLLYLYSHRKTINLFFGFVMPLLCLSFSHSFGKLKNSLRPIPIGNRYHVGDANWSFCGKRPASTKITDALVLLMQLFHRFFVNFIKGRKPAKKLDAVQRRFQQLAQTNKTQNFHRKSIIYSAQSIAENLSHPTEPYHSTEKSCLEKSEYFARDVFDQKVPRRKWKSWIFTGP